MGRTRSYVLTPVPLKLISQNKIASCDVLPLGPDFRVVPPIRFGAKHRGQPFAFGSGSYAIPQSYACPAKERAAVTISSRVYRARRDLDQVKNPKVPAQLGLHNIHAI